MEPNKDRSDGDNAPSPGCVSDTPTSPARSWGLYFLPALIVLAFVMGWLFLVWMFHENPDPHRLAKDLQNPGRQSWQKAFTVAQLLLSSEAEHLKRDEELCRTLAAALATHTQAVATARQEGRVEDPERMHLRVFLCRALGEFQTDAGLPALLTCAAMDTATLPKGSLELEVRRAALEAIAVLADRLSPDRVRSDSHLLEVLLAATRETSIDAADSGSSDVVSTAVFTLGVVGGQEAIARMTELLSDPRPEVRFNAAIGLSRNMRSEALPALLEMLTPNHLQLSSESVSSPAQRQKQLTVLTSGIRAATRLAPSLEPDSRRRLHKQIEVLSCSEAVPSRVRIDAKAALLEFNRHNQAGCNN